MYKKLFSFLIVLSMTLVIFAGVTISVLAEGEEVVASGNCGTEGNESSVTWSLDNNGVLTISGTGAMGDYYSILPAWFNNKDTIKSVVINNGVTEIGYAAFENCKGLTSVTISNSVTVIAREAFYGCTSLTSIEIPESVTIIGDYALKKCENLKTVFYPDTCEVYIGAFNNTPAARIKYSVSGGKLIITDIILKAGNEPVVIDTSKYTYDETNNDLMKKIAHDHTGGTATCVKKAECTICGIEYGDLAQHTYVNGSCTKCSAADPNAGTTVTDPTVTEPAETDPDETDTTVTEPDVTDPTGTSPTGTEPAGTSPTVPSVPTRPSAPSYPSSPSVTTAAAETTTVTVTTAEEIIADGDYTGEDVSAGAGIHEDGRDISEKSTKLIVIAIAAVVACAVIVKKIIF